MLYLVVFGLGGCSRVVFMLFIGCIFGAEGGRTRRVDFHFSPFLDARYVVML